ncbi:MAG: bifunctional riboflavin kinase/FAD synthetase [Eubacteriales bacterium]|nr:bifunctional riboflavin kinase/FAD synthetase [Eubacteriales bacterium]
MNVFYPNDTWDLTVHRGVALGFFDGVHRGHQDLIRTLVYLCEQRHLRPTVFTFPEHPLVTISPEGQFPGYLSTLEQRMQRIADTGIQEVFLQDFTTAFAALPPLEFLNSILKDHLQARLIVVGNDYRFGYEGEGDLVLLRAWAAEHQIEVVIVPEVRLYGEKVSSSRIRRLIAAGDTQIAASCLGLPFQMTGHVVEGKKLGRKLGFPTANMAISPDLAVPAFGVYVTRTRVGNRMYESITNIGIRPTIQDSAPKPNIESFLFDADLDLYSQEITVEFLYRLRPEVIFDSLLELAEQVEIDLLQARDYHRTAEHGYEITRINGTPVRVLKTTRFAQATAILTFRLKITRAEASLFSMLSRLLTASCQRYPTRSSLSAALDSLYGASIENEVSKDGDLLSLHFAVNALMNWTNQTSPFAAALDVLFDLLEKPDFDQDGHFTEAMFAAERDGLRMELLSRQNDKAKFALDQCMNRLCGDQPAGLRASGDLVTLETIQREDLTAAYRRLITDLDFQVSIAGNLSNDLIEHLFERVRQLRTNTPVLPEAHEAYRPVYLLRPGAFSAQALDNKNLRESKQVEQARICLALTGLKPYFSHQSIIDTVMNSMLGGDVHSLLFDVVREQMGLAYSVYSVNSRYLSTLLVIAGVAPDRVDEALAAILEQVNNLKTGTFSPRLFERAVTLVESTIRTIPDDLDSLLAHMMNGVTLGRTVSIHDSLSLLESVTIEQIIERAGHLNVQNSYILTAKGETL